MPAWPPVSLAMSAPLEQPDALGRLTNGSPRATFARVW